MRIRKLPHPQVGLGKITPISPVLLIKLIQKCVKTDVMETKASILIKNHNLATGLKVA